MTRLQIKGLVIIVVLALSLYFIYPTIKWYLMSDIERANAEKMRDKILNKIINLGLDLKGGIHLVLELDDSKISSETDLTDALDRVIEIIRNRVDQFGVTEPIIVRQGEKWIVVELPGIKNPETAKNLIGKTALLEFKLLGPSEKLSSINEKIRQLGLNITEARNNPEILALVPTGYVLLPGKNEESLYLVKSSPEITGAYLVNARTRLGGQFGLPYVSLDFNKEGAKIFATVTGANIDKNLAIVLDDVVQSAPVIRSRIPDGKAIIEGNFTEEEAKFLATILRAGSLPAPVKIIEERSIGPTLGEDSIQKGTISSILGLLLVIIFMIIYYNISGVIANIALILNFIILLASLALFRFTLTLPGIAGIALTLGMAIDANVLILERLRDELELGKTPRVALDLGYSRALTTIIDSNLTTLIAAVFLFQFGTGPIKGFAVTLTLGILISMFTAIFVTKTIYEFMFQENLIRKVKL
jgi:protein-export membrane protein SecD